MTVQRFTVAGLFLAAGVFLTVSAFLPTATVYSFTNAIQRYFASRTDWDVAIACTLGIGCLWVALGVILSGRGWFRRPEPPIAGRSESGVPQVQGSFLVLVGALGIATLVVVASGLGFIG